MVKEIISIDSLTELNYEKNGVSYLSKNHINIKRQEIKLPEILFISSFPPRECGIATYSQDLINALTNQFENSFVSKICALESDTEKHIYTPKVKLILNTECSNSYKKNAFYINNDNNIKLVVLQHEFGFFSKNEKDFQQFIKNISKPIVIVFHTVLPAPNEELKLKVQEMGAIAKSIIVMTTNSANILQSDYAISKSKILVIPHGTHLVKPLDKVKLKHHYGLSQRKVLSTFGLLGSSKNIETTLQALPSVIKNYPDILFLILGKTHPSLVKQEGEKYRKMLEDIVIQLDINKHVRFVNEYLPLHSLLEYLQLSDIYLFTSKDPNQAVSGTFSYAASSGCPVISTPIPHAKEVLSNNNGIIIDFEDVTQLSKTIIHLLDNEQLRAEITLNSFHKMASTVWQNSALAHAKVFEKFTSKAFQLSYKAPVINLSHIKNMTTNFGMIQFSKIAHPDKFSGYTLDDNARAMIAICQHFEMYKNDDDLVLIETYLECIKRCIQPDGYFLNYINERNEFTAQNYVENLEDSNGRAIWAIGFASSLVNILPKRLINDCELLLQKALPYLSNIHSTRAMSFIIKGLYYNNNKENLALLQTFANRLVQMYKHERTDNWSWFEDYLTYGNSLMPEAMLCAYLSTNNEDYKTIAKDSLEFLLSKIIIDVKLKVISNRGWLTKDKNKESVKGGEQPIDVAYTIMTLEKFYFAFNDDEYRRKAIIAFNWFLGENHLNQIVYNPCTGGCYDGVEEFNVNLNQGAESTISYLMARLAIERMYAENNSTLIDYTLQLVINKGMQIVRYESNFKELHPIVNKILSKVDERAIIV
jgi:glycosyltransferase involved in cell wall biosynthesis